MRERPQGEIRQIPKIDLMLPVQIEYYLAWHDLLGNQQKVLYNAMGPDVSTVLLATNARTIVGIDEMGLYADQFEDKIQSFWDEIRSPKVYKGWEPKEGEWKRFNEDLDHRKAKGYWDITNIERWETPKLLALELKELGVGKSDIAISGFRQYGVQAGIKFKWAYPGEGLKDREIIYLRGTLAQVLMGKRGKYIRNIDCFYQKGLPDDELTPYCLRIVLPRLNDRVVVAVGYKTWGENENFREQIWNTLGPMFASLGVNPRLESQIDRLPDDDPEPAMIQYGMKLHVFKRG